MFKIISTISETSLEGIMTKDGPINVAEVKKDGQKLITQVINIFKDGLCLNSFANFSINAAFLLNHLRENGNRN